MLDRHKGDITTRISNPTLRDNWDTIFGKDSGRQEKIARNNTGGIASEEQLNHPEDEDADRSNRSN